MENNKKFSEILGEIIYQLGMWLMSAAFIM